MYIHKKVYSMFIGLQSAVCRLHEALQEVHQMLVRPPVPVNPFPAVSNIFLRYGCRLDLWDSRLVIISNAILSFYG